jgi:energy-coupling factor transporter ATP-binding protein EcfA2
LQKLNQAGKTIIMVTHENDIAAWAKRVVRMRDGLIESDEINHHAPLEPSPPPASTTLGTAFVGGSWDRHATDKMTNA